MAPNMKTQAPAKRIRPRPAAAVPTGAKTTFPEPLLRASAGVRKAGLPCVKRMPAYLQMLRVLQAEGQENVSGTVLAGVHNLEPVIVRKDLAMTGAVGTPRIGFRIPELIAAIERFLGWDNQTKAVLVGVGSLGTALLGYQGFQNFGFRIVGAFDQDQKTIGKWVHGRKVQAVDQLAPFVRRGEILLGVLTVPAPVAQGTAELMVRAGIQGIWNFTPTKLALPEEVVTQKEDLAEGIAVLSHRLSHRSHPVTEPVGSCKQQ
jgi:redox-sensing transcriptional repressor